MHDFTLDHDDIKDVHSKKFKHVKGEMDEIKLVLGFIDHFSESQKMSNFKERNSIILEMLDQNKNDRDFGKQLM